MKAVLFDFDGVLTTDHSGSFSVCSYVSRAAGIDPEAFSAAYGRYNPQLQSGQRTHREVWGHICQELGRAIPYEILFQSFLATPIDWEMVALVRELKSKGCRTGLVTDNKQDRLDAVLAFYNWYGLFDAIALSSAVGTGKDDPAIFDLVCNRLSLTPEDCVFIDNSARNLVIPQRMGFATILYDDKVRDLAGLAGRLKGFGLL